MDVGTASPPVLVASVAGATFDALPDDVRTSIALHLDADDALRLVSATRTWFEVGRGTSLWKAMLSREGGGNGRAERDGSEARGEDERAHDLKEEFLRAAQLSTLSSVRWRPVLTPSYSGPSDREGHGMCALGEGGGWIALTGGFTNDEAVHFLNVGGGGGGGGGGGIVGAGSWSGSTSRLGWDHVRPGGDRPPFAYGASLTAIDDRRAVRFGGFMSGGYTDECADVLVLTVGLPEASVASGVGAVPAARWERVRPRGRTPRGRAYHTATLVSGRFLVFTGGMTEGGSIMDVAVLDVEAWTWLGGGGGGAAEERGAEEEDRQQGQQSHCHPLLASCGLRVPDGRHGHSVVLDAPRNRLVMFGGGSGSDLLRSGRDNSEVWELRLGKGWDDGTEEGFLKSLPWRWRLLHEDSRNAQLATGRAGEEKADAGNAEDEGASTTASAESSRGGRDDAQGRTRPAGGSPSRGAARGPALLSPAERLCLGRCHVAAHVSPSRVVFAFGGGRPSTNGVLAFDLRSDEWRRPTVSGPLPPPRFTGASVAVRGGWLLVHGGFRAGEGSLGDVAVLDLAPRALSRRGRGRTFGALPPWDDAPSHRPIEDEDLGGLNYDRPGDSAAFMSFLLDAPPGQRQVRAQHLVNRLMHDGGAANQQLLMWLMAVASGRVGFETSDDEDDDDSTLEEE